MLIVNQGHEVLVIYPVEFARYGLFSLKMQQLDRSLGDYQVFAPQDPRGFLSKYFGPRFKLRSHPEQHRRHRAALLDSATHAVVFWDGSERLGDYVFLATLRRKKLWTIPIETTRVVNRDAGQEFDVYIGRKGPWGNPYAIGPDGDRDDVIAKYESFFRKEILGNEEKLKSLLTLRGKRLGCHCKPARCHGDVIAEYLNNLEPQDHIDEQPDLFRNTT